MTQFVSAGLLSISHLSPVVFRAWFHMVWWFLGKHTRIIAELAVSFLSTAQYQSHSFCLSQERTYSQPRFRPGLKNKTNNLLQEATHKPTSNCPVGNSMEMRTIKLHIQRSLVFMSPILPGGTSDAQQGLYPNVPSKCLDTVVPTPTEGIYHSKGPQDCRSWRKILQLGRVRYCVSVFQSP